MKITTWNINGVKARIEGALTYLKEAQPDVLCLQEIKSVDEGFPRDAFEDLGYPVATHGQKGFNGVAILSKPPLEDVTRGLPGDDGDEQSRYIEATVAVGSAARCASPRSTSPTAIRSAPRSSPTSSPGCAGSKRARARAARRPRCRSFWPAISTSFPSPTDAQAAGGLAQRRALPAGKPRGVPAACCNLGLTDAIRACHPGAGRLHVLGLSGRLLAEGRRHPHRSSAAVAAGVDLLVGAGIDKHHARLGEAVRPRAGLGRAQSAS